MKVIEGRITGIVPTGSYNSKYGLVHTSELSIQAQDGLYVGEIGEKSPDTKYAVGQDISVTVTGEPPNVRLKKYNPNFPDQQASRGTQQPPQRAAQGQKSKDEVDWDAIAEGKVRHGIVCAYLQGGTEPNIGRVLYWADFIMTGNAPLPPAKEGTPSRPEGAPF